MTTMVLKVCQACLSSASAVVYVVCSVCGSRCCSHLINECDNCGISVCRACSFRVTPFVFDENCMIEYLNLTD